MTLDNTQKAALIAIPVLIVGVLIYAIAQWNIEAEAEQAAEEEQARCDTWSDELENHRDILDARQDSLAGSLDLDGSTEGMRLQFNQEIHQWNTECANGDYSNENE